MRNIVIVIIWSQPPIYSYTLLNLNLDSNLFFYTSLVQSPDSIKMGIVSNMAHRMRNNRLSKRLSISSSKDQDEDANDLIKPTETASLARPSVESTITIIRHSFHDSDSNKLQLQTNTNMNTRTLFDRTPISPGALSREYPMFKLDMCQSRFEAEPHLEQNDRHRVENGEKSDYNSGTVDKKKRSMKALLKRHCGLNIPRSSLSLKTSSSSPAWLDSGDDEALVEMKSEKLLEVHLQDQKKSKLRGFRMHWLDFCFRELLLVQLWSCAYGRGRLLFRWKSIIIILMDFE